MAQVEGQGPSRISPSSLDLLRCSDHDARDLSSESLQVIGESEMTEDS